MYAILETGGKQYKVKEGDIIEVEHISQKNIAKNSQVSFAEVLLIQDKELYLGQPYVPDAQIQATILEAIKAPKIVVFKKKSKKGYKRTRGHRQMLHRLKIEKIEIRKTAKSGKEPAVVKEEKVKTVQNQKSKKAPATRKKTAPAKTVKTTTTAKKAGKSTAAAKTPKKTETAKPQPRKTTKKEKEK